MRFSCFNIYVISCFAWHLTSAYQSEVDKQFTNKTMKLKDQISFIIKAVSKIDEKLLKIDDLFRANERIEQHVSELCVKLDKMDQKMSSLNETVEQLKNDRNFASSNLSKINSDQIGNYANKTEKQTKCNVSDVRELFNLSSSTLFHTWSNMNMSLDQGWVSEFLSVPALETEVQVTIRGFGGTLEQRFFPVKNRTEHRVKPELYFVLSAENEQTYIDSMNIDDFRSSKDLNRGFGMAVSSVFRNLQNKPFPGYGKGQTFSIEVHIETPEMSNAFQSDNGTVRGTLCPYSKIREWRAKELIKLVRSPYFYTSVKGYRAVVGFNVNGETGCLDIVLTIISGLNDSLLKEPKFRATVTIINQVHVDKSLTQVKDSYGPFLLMHFATPPGDFILNDQLMYEAEVEIINL